MATTLPAEQVAGLKGLDVYDSSGQKIGKVEDYYYDEETGLAEWLGISAGILGFKHLLVPIGGMQQSEDRITVPYKKDLVTATPDIDDDELTDEHEQALHEHYGLPPDAIPAGGESEPHLAEYEDTRDHAEAPATRLHRPHTAPLPGSSVTLPHKHNE